MMKQTNWNQQPSIIQRALGPQTDTFHRRCWEETMVLPGKREVYCIFPWDHGRHESNQKMGGGQVQPNIGRTQLLPFFWTLHCLIQKQGDPSLSCFSTVCPTWILVKTNPCESIRSYIILRTSGYEEKCGTIIFAKEEHDGNACLLLTVNPGSCCLANYWLILINWGSYPTNSDELLLKLVHPGSKLATWRLGVIDSTRSSCEGPVWTSADISGLRLQLVYL